MNLVFGSEVALLGFWEYMFRNLFRVRKQDIFFYLPLFFPTQKFFLHTAVSVDIRYCFGNTN
jgi:hypothetical protein